MALNHRAPKCVKQKLRTEGRIDNSTIVVGIFNTVLSITDRATRQKNNKEVEDLNNTMNRLELTDIY